MFFLNISMSLYQGEGKLDCVKLGSSAGCSVVTCYKEHDCSTLQNNLDSEHRKLETNIFVLVKSSVALPRLC